MHGEGTNLPFFFRTCRVRFIQNSDDKGGVEDEANSSGRRERLNVMKNIQDAGYVSTISTLREVEKW